MAINRYHEFHRNLRYYTGSGCLICGSNIGPCIDLGISDDIDGAIVLCENHARECGVLVGLVPKAEADEKLAQAEAAWTEAENDRIAAAEDREVVERILGRLRQPELDEDSEPKVLSQPKGGSTKAKK